MKNNYLMAVFLCIYSVNASANIVLTSRNSSSSAQAVHQTLNNPVDGYGYDADSAITVKPAFSGSTAQASPYSYGANANTVVYSSNNGFTVGGGAYASAPNSGSFSFSQSQSHIELYFSVDSLTHVDITLSEDRLGGYLASGLLQLYQGNTLLTGVSSQTDYTVTVPQPQYLSLNLAAGNYKILGDYSAQAHYGQCILGCEAYSTIAFTTTATVAVVPVPAAAWLMGSGLLGLIAVARRKIA